MHDWTQYFNAFDRSFLRFIGEDPYWLPTDRNVITDALKDTGLIQRYLNQHNYTLSPKEAKRIVNLGLTGAALDKEIDKISWKTLKAGRLPLNKKSLARLATLCQAIVFDNSGGPELDSKPKALRRHWYTWFKAFFAQPLSRQLGEDLQHKRWGLNWFGVLSVAYGDLVDIERTTYKDLWVKDASRMIQAIDIKLFKAANIILAIEKDSLLEDFIPAAKALGAAVLFSGKGKPSKAAIEKIFREHFGWPGRDVDVYEDGQWIGTEYQERFGPDDQVIIIHVSDYDYTGRKVIGPAFAEQARRYCDNVLEYRIGIEPQALQDKGYRLIDKKYEQKASNGGEIEWAHERALFVAECENGHGQMVLGSSNDFRACAECGAEFNEIIPGKPDIVYGLEVEAMFVSDYSDLIVQALLRVLPFEDIVAALRDECVADVYETTYQITQSVYEDNESYQEMQREIDTIRDAQSELEKALTKEVEPLAEAHKHDFRDDDDDPEPEDFEKHVVGAEAYTTAWRPFSTWDRTESLVEFIQEDLTDELDELKKLDVGVDRLVFEGDLDITLDGNIYADSRNVAETILEWLDSSSGYQEGEFRVRIERV